MSPTHMNKVENFDIKVSNSIEHAMRKKGWLGIAGSVEDVWYATYHIKFSEFLGHFKTITWSSQYRLYHDSEDEERDRTRIPDFVILRSWADNFKGKTSFDRLWVLAVVEVKPLDFEIPVDDDDEEVDCRDARFIRASNQAFYLCEKQARTQCKFVFAKNKTQKVVFAMHCVGPYWTYTKYSRGSLSPFMANNYDGDYVEQSVSIQVQERDVAIAMVGTPHSKLKFNRMLYKMKDEFANPEENEPGVAPKGKGKEESEW